MKDTNVAKKCWTCIAVVCFQKVIEENESVSGVSGASASVF